MQDRRPSFLLALGDRLRNIVDARAITDATAGALGRHMSATRVVYAEIDESAPDTQTSGPTGPTAQFPASSAAITSTASGPGDGARLARRQALAGG